MSKIQKIATGAYYKENILGTVSQTSGVPTGAIIESGSNANGSYTKFANGTLICTAAISFGSTLTGTFGSIFIGPIVTWRFPTSFVNGTTPSVSGTPVNWSACWLGYGGQNVTDSTAAYLALFSGWAIDTEGTLLNATVTAIGRWY